MTIDKTELEKKVASGEAKKVHLYNFTNILRPRGHMKKESIGVYVQEQLSAYYESWTHKGYGDNPSPSEVLEMLEKNLIEEIDGAWKLFNKSLEGPSET